MLFFLGESKMQLDHILATISRALNSACFCAKLEALDISIGDEVLSYPFPAGPEHVAILSAQRDGVPALTRKERKRIGSVARVVGIDADSRSHHAGLDPNAFDGATIRWSAKWAEDILIWGGGTSSEIDRAIARKISSGKRLLFIMTNKSNCQSSARAIFAMASRMTETNVVTSRDTFH